LVLFDYGVLFGAFVVLGLEGAVEVTGFAMKLLVSVFGVPVFAQVNALAASAGEGFMSLAYQFKCGHYQNTI
jgi:hypothetical protein